MTTKEQAERLINQLREQGFTDEDIIEATIGLFEMMRDGNK